LGLVSRFYVNYLDWRRDCRMIRFIEIFGKIDDYSYSDRIG
jgi:hypothetical protein